MPNTQKNIVGTGTVFYKLVDGIEEVRSGCLLKSPPASKFKTVRAWKRRFFVLFRINGKEYSLKYFKSSDERDKPLGGIQISQISMIFCSPQSHSRWSWVHKTFNCNPASVLFIRAANRDYFLIDESNGHMEGWLQDISQILLSRSDSQFGPEMLTQVTANPMMANGSSQQGSEHCILLNESTSRSFSDPVHPLNITHNASQKSINDKGPEKSRALSDPVSKLDMSNINSPEYGSQPEMGDANTIHTISNPVYEEFQFNFRRPSSADSSSSDKSTSELSSAISQEPIYDTPRNILKYWNQDSTDIDDEIQNEEVVESFYMRMDTVHEALTMGQEGSEEIVASSPAEEPQLPTPPAGKSRISPADILSNWAKNKPSTSSRLESQNDCFNHDLGTVDVKEITVNQTDLKTHLSLVEVDGKPCISNWPALPETKCLFRKGDEILAVNDLQTESVEEVQTYLTKLLKDQVKLTVRRPSASEASQPSRWGSDSAIE